MTLKTLLRSGLHRFKVVTLLTLGFGAAASATPAAAQDLVYQPINPSFGGNPFNSSHLLSIANAVNDHEPPGRASSTSRRTGITDVFARQLQSRLLSELSRDITDAIFGENAQESGEVVFGSQRVTFFRTLENVNVTIADSETGTVNEFSVPLLQLE